MRICRKVVALLLQALALMLAHASPAWAQTSQLPTTHIAAELLAEGPAAPGGTVTLAVAFRPAKGWHGYWKNPGDAGFGTTLDWQLPQGMRAGDARYPVPRTLVVAGLMNHVYEEDYALLVPLALPADALPGSRLPVRVKANWLACTDQICVPERAELATEVIVGAPGTPTPPQSRFDAWRAKLPAPLGTQARFELAGNTIRIGIPLPLGMKLDSPHLFVSEGRIADYAAPQDFRRKGDELVVTVARPRSDRAAPAAISGVLSLDRAGNGVEFAGVPGAVAPGGEPLAPLSSGTTSLAALLLAALAGGLLLNVMPCVFPILSLKALSLARAGESQAEARVEGLAYTAGVVLACAGLGALLLVLRAAGNEVGWAFQLQEPRVVALLLLLAAAITANLAGLYEITLPGLSRAGSPQGAFATGLLAAFAATPCTGPFMAAAMGAALLLPPVQAMALFVVLGLGLALPFLVIALVPGVRRLLPRPGRWMNVFRKAMAVPMGLTVLALAWLGWRLAGTGFALAAIALALGLVVLLALGGKRQRRGLALGRGVGVGLAGMVVAAALALPALQGPPPAAAGEVLASAPYSAEALAQSRQAGRPVFLYFTADWCLTCKVNEQVAIEREKTRAAFERAGVVVLKGDWTRRDPLITRYLTAMGAAGVPLYVWYPAGRDGQVLPQLLSVEMLAALPANK